MQPCYYLKDYLYLNKKGHLPSCYSADMIVSTTDTCSYTHTYIFKDTHTRWYFNCSKEVLTTWPSRIPPCFYRSLRLGVAAAREGRSDHIVRPTTQFNSLPVSVVSRTYTLKCKRATFVFSAASFSKADAIITWLSLSLISH